MNYKIHLRNWSSFKRFLRWRYLRFQYVWSSRDSKPKKPKKMTESERTATAIYIKLLFDPGTKLYYDLHTQECYLRSEDSTLFVFLEQMNVKIINTVYGYDVPISRETESYLLEKFRREMAIRRLQFKKEALSKVEHSLEGTLEKLNQKYKNDA